MMVCLLCVGLPEGVEGVRTTGYLLPGSVRVQLGLGEMRWDGMGWDDGVDGWMDGSSRGERGSIRSCESSEVRLELELWAWCRTSYQLRQLWQNAGLVAAVAGLLCFRCVMMRCLHAPAEGAFGRDVVCSPGGPC